MKKKVVTVAGLSKNLSIIESDRFFTDSIIPRIVTSAVRNCAKSQAVIASELSINANLITMFKQGRTKVPIGRAGELARALEIPETPFVRLVLEEYHSDILAAIEQTFVLSKTEAEAELFRSALTEQKK